jgi:hypothetical protein
MEYIPAKDIIIGNHNQRLLIAKKKQEEAMKVAKSCDNGKCNLNINATVSGKKNKDYDEIPVSDKVGIETGKIIMEV